MKVIQIGKQSNLFADDILYTENHVNPLKKKTITTDETKVNMVNLPDTKYVSGVPVREQCRKTLKSPSL